MNVSSETRQAHYIIFRYIVHNFFNNDRKRKYESLFIYIRLIILEECAHLFQKKSLKITKETSGGMEIVSKTTVQTYKAKGKNPRN
jgi:hypothetical protein